MPQNIRVGDLGQGICPCHKSPQNYLTQLLTGAATVFTNGAGQGLVGSIGQASCGHLTQHLTGSNTVDCEGAQIGRVADLCETSCGGLGQMITGSPNVDNDL